MDEHGKIDVVSLGQLVEYHIAAGTAGIVAMGTTGESATLDLDEHLDVVAKTQEFAAGRHQCWRAVAPTTLGMPLNWLVISNRWASNWASRSLLITTNRRKMGFIATMPLSARLVVWRKFFIMYRDAPVVI